MKLSEVRGYKIQEMIGKGSFGKVYRGSHLVTGEKVALKIIECQGKKKQQLNNLRQEINIMKKLKHPNIINLIDFAETPSEIIIIMEFAQQDMSVLLEKLKKLPQEQVRSICRQIIEALMYLNQNRIVHRDLKPQNILLVDKNIPKICDFGFAKKMSASTVCLHSMKGTPLYIAPEIILEKPYNHKIDVWSFGVIIYQFYTGIPPFYADSFPKLGPKILNDKVIYPKNMPLELKQLLQGMLQKSPSLRFDWKEILNHPFFNVKNKNNDKQNNLPQSWMLDQNFKMVESQYNFDPHANLNPAEVDLTTMKQIQNNIVHGRTQAKSYKSDPILYHQIMSIINKFGQESPSCQSDNQLIRTVLAIELHLVRKKTDNKEDDFTKKPQLLISVAKLIPNFSQQEILIQIYTLLGFLLKSNFNDLNLQVESAQQIVVSSAQLLCKSGKISPNLLHYVSIAIGVIAGQAMSNLVIAEDLIKDVEESRLLYYLTNRINRGQTSITSIFQCLCKFIHPLKGNKVVINPKLLSVFGKLKSQVGLALSSKLHDFVSYGTSLLGNQLDHFFYVVYESIKQSEELKIKILERKFEILPLLQKNRLYCLAINFILQKHSKFKFALFSQQHTICALKSIINKPIQQLLLASSITQSFNITPPSDSLSKLLVQKLNKLIDYERRIKQQSLEQLDGWSYGTYTNRFDDLIVLSYTQLLKSSDNVLKTPQIYKIIPNLIRIQHSNNETCLNISPKYFKYLMQIYHDLKSSISTNDRKVFLNSLAEGLSILTLQTHLCSIKQDQGQKQFYEFVELSLSTIYDIEDTKYNRDFYTKLSQTEIHRHVFRDEEIKPNILIKSLRTININFRYSKDHNTLDYIAVQGLPKLKQFIAIQNNDLLLQIVLIVTHLARTKQDYYPNINQLGIVKCIPRYLQGGKQLKVATLKLLANLLKHSDEFLDQLIDLKIFDLITTNMELQENIVILTQNAIANACHFRQLPEYIIEPIIKCMPCLLVFPEHQNDNRALDAILSLCNFLRHGPKHLHIILKSRVIGKVLNILDEVPNNNHLINASIRLISKVMDNNGKGDLLKYHTKEEIVRVINKVKPAEVKDAFGKMASAIRQKLGG